MLSLAGDDTEDLEPFNSTPVGAHAAEREGIEGQILHSWGDLLHSRSLQRRSKARSSRVALSEANSLRDLGTTYNSLGRLCPGATGNRPLRSSSS
jgi:hypothetical protein